MKANRQKRTIETHRSLIAQSPSSAFRSSLVRHHQTGVSAIEFALVFPVFFMILYAIISYGLIMVAQQSISLAAAEGARASVRYAATEAVRNTHAQAAALGNGSPAFWLASRVNFNGQLLATCPYEAGNGRCYRVTVTYPNYRQNPLTPLLLGPLMGFSVPSQLSSTAIAQID